MNIKIMLASFVTIFLAELGDKTQLAALSFATNTRAPWSVFIGTSVALVCTTALAVVFGDAVTRYVPERALQIGSATMFVLIGLYLLVNVACRGQGKAAEGAAGAAVIAPVSVGSGMVCELIFSQARVFEEDSARLYEELSAVMPSGAARRRLEQLAQEERQHADALRTLTARHGDAAITGAQLAESEVQPLRDSVRTPPAAAPLSAAEQAQAAQASIDEPVQRAIRAEERAAEYYLALARLANLHPVRDAFRWLAMEELRHAQELCSLINHDREPAAPSPAAGEVT